MSRVVQTEERRALVHALRDYVAREFGTREQRERASPDTEDPAVLRDVTRKLGALGWIGVALPEEYGGGGGGIVDACLIVEELWYGRVPSAGLVVSMIAGNAVQKFGTDTQKRSILPEISTGQVCSIAMSEPDAGSDVASLQCRAERTDGGYVLNGQKMWISAAHYAHRILLVCRTSNDGPKHAGISMLDVPTDTPGLEISGMDTLGGREVNQLYFTDAHVGLDRLVGAENEGWSQLMAGLNFERLVGAAGFLGLARRVLDDTLDYVRKREQFGRPVGSFQAIKHRIADLATEVEACRLLVYQVAATADAKPGTQYPKEASMAKLKTSEVLKAAALEGMQMTGGMGYTKELGMEAHLRHAVATTVHGGASELQREIIAKQLGL